MRRRKGEIFVKDFVDPKTARDLVKLADPKKEGGKKHTQREDLFKYLAEPRTIQEVMARFSYGSLHSAYMTLHHHIKSGLIINLGHGLYVAAQAGATSFNVADLSEHELQERGLEAFKANLESKKEQIEITKGEGGMEKAEQSRRTGMGNRGVKRHLKIKAHSDRFEAIEAFLQTPRTVEEVQEHIGYAGYASAHARVRAMEYEGTIEGDGSRAPKLVWSSKRGLSATDARAEYKDRVNGPLHQPGQQMVADQKREAEIAAHIDHSITHGTPVPPTTPQPVSSTTRLGELGPVVERIAKDYIWENEGVMVLEVAAIKEFVEYVKNWGPVDEAS